MANGGSGPPPPPPPPRKFVHYSWLWIHDDVIKWKHFPRHWPFVRESTGQRWIPLTKASDAELWCFLYRSLNKRLSKQSRRQWFETTSRSLWRHCNEEDRCFAPRIMHMIPVLLSQRIVWLNRAPEQTTAIQKQTMSISLLLDNLFRKIFQDRRRLPYLYHTSDKITSNGSWRQGIKGEMTCTGYVALVWNIIYRIMTIILIIVTIIIIMIIIITTIKRWWWW